MKIAYDAKRYFSNRTGLGNYSRDLIRIMEQYYPEHSYLKYSNSIKNAISDSEDLLKNSRTPASFIDKLIPSLWRTKGIVKDLVHENIDIFHGLSGEIPVGLNKTAIKSVVTIHDLIFLRYPELYKPIDRWIYDKKFKFAVQHANKIIAISEQTKADIIDFYHVNEDKIEVIYQTCHSAFKIKKTKNQQEIIRKKHNLPQQFILNVGSIEKRKNVLQVVKAMHDIDMPLLIIGKKTPYLTEIEAYIQSHNLRDKIIIKQGFTTEELAVIYSMASLFIYPSIFEGFGIPIIEALYSGVPVITTNSGVFPEAGGPNSYYINPSNVEEINYAIKAILNDSTKITTMVNGGLSYVQRFNDSNIAQNLMHCYKNIL